MFRWKDYEENSALFINGISENVAVLRYKDFQLTDSATGLKVKMKSSNIDEAKVDAENYLKSLWDRVYKNYKRNLDMKDTTTVEDGVTSCCGYDFGEDAFSKKIKIGYCPICGKKIVDEI
jgi:hypothetical protein